MTAGVIRISFVLTEESVVPNHVIEHVKVRHLPSPHSLEGAHYDPFSYLTRHARALLKKQYLVPDTWAS